MGDVNLEIKLNNIDERVIKIEESGGSGGDGYITSVSNDFNVLNKKLSLSNDVTTKLSKVDTTDNLSVELARKIDKPASATDGQVLTYNGTSNEWEAQDSKGGADDTSIISDAYDELKTYVAGEYCIYNNSLWKCLVQNNGQTPTEGTYWTNVSVANEIASVNSSLAVKTGVVTVDSSIYSPKSALRKSGNIVEVYVYGQLKKNFEKEAPFATIPLEYAPKSNVDVAGRNALGLTLFRIDTNGNISSVTTALNTNNFINVQTTYIRE